MVLRIYINSSACVRIKEGEFLRTNSGVRQRCVTYTCLFNAYMGRVKKEGRIEVGNQKTVWVMIKHLLRYAKKKGSMKLNGNKN